MCGLRNWCRVEGDVDGRRRDLIATMIVHAPPLAGASAAPAAADCWSWLEMLDRLRVGEECGCGACPSFTLELAGRKVPRGQHRHVLAASTGESLVLLIVDDGVVSGVEVAPRGDGSVGLPAVDELSF